MSTAILGGGLSGLSAAYYLSKTVKNQKIVLIEGSNRLGGWIKSNLQENGVIFEEGPRTIRPRGETGINTLNLIDELNISNQIVPILNSSPAAKNRMIYVNGKLYSLPSSFSGLFKVQPPFKKPLVNYFANDLFAKKESLTDDTLYNFAERRFGIDIAEYLFSPLICGICAGNAKEISVKFLMKNLFEYEQKYGNISNGLFRNFFNRSDKEINRSKLVERVNKEKWNVYSFKNGCETLTKTLEKTVKNCNNVEFRMETNCELIEFTHNNKNVILNCNDKSTSVNNLISSVPSKILAKSVKTQHPKLSELLENIKFVTVGVVNLCYKGKQLQKEGFGFLVPPKENIPILGVIFDSCCFPNEENTVLTVMLGGAFMEKFFGKNPTSENLLETSKKHVAQILGINDEPLKYKVNILENCIPQYTVGHYENLEKIEGYIKDNNLPIYLCGSSYYGVGVNDVILSAKNAANTLMTNNKIETS